MSFDVAVKQSIKGLIEVREKILKKIEKIHSLNSEICELESIAFGGAKFYGQPKILDGYEKHDKFYSLKSWEILIKECKITNSMSEKGKTNYMEKIKKDTPIFNDFNINAFAQNVSNMYEDGFKGLLDDVWKSFQNCSYVASGGGYWYKKDNINRIKEKFIIMHGFDFSKYTKRISYSGYKNELWEDMYSLCHILDGKSKPDYANNFNSMAHKEIKEKENVIECDYFSLKIYKNCNVHVTWNKNKIHILEKINSYGAGGGLPDIREKKYKREHFEDGPKYKTSTPKNQKEESFFETPKHIAKQLINIASIKHNEKILEPSAGNGAILKHLPMIPHIDSVFCYEINPTRYNILKLNGNNVIGRNFLECKETFDVIIANPPFAKMQDVDHVNHMIKCAKRKVVSVMSAGTLFRKDHKTIDFRNRIERLGGVFHKLPILSFSDAGTNVNTIIVEINL